MTPTRREPISQFIEALDVELRHGDVEVADSADGEVVASEPIECHVEGSTLVVRPAHHEADLEIRVPTTLRRVSLFTGNGDLRIDCSLDEIRARTGRGDVSLSGGGQGEVDSGHGDVEIADWAGSVRVGTGAGDVSVERVTGPLDVRTGRGDVSVADAPAGARVQTGNGDISVERLGGECDLRTGNGDVEARALVAADLALHTGRGEISIDGTLRGLRARTGHGDLSLRAALLAGDFAAESGHGGIVVELPADADVRIEAVTGHGRVETNLPLVRVGRRGPTSDNSRRFVGSVGSQNPPAQLSVRTNRGEIRINAADWMVADSSAAGATDRPGEPKTTATERAWAETLRAFDEGLGARSETLRTSAESLGSRSEALRTSGESLDARSDALRASAETAGADAAPPTSAAEPAATASGAADRDELAILEAVSRGEITVDEALALIGR